jgi:hypothetical protein
MNKLKVALRMLDSGVAGERMAQYSDKALNESKEGYAS